MSPINPRSIVQNLYTHWGVIEKLMYVVAEQPTLDEEQVLAVISTYSGSNGNPRETLNALLKFGILKKLERIDVLQINQIVLDFVRGLTRETELELSEVLKTRIEHIKNATELLSVGTNESDQEKMFKGATEMISLTSTIIRQLDQSQDAILNLVDKAQSDSLDAPLAKRYERVFEAYDCYVKPMMELMDPSATGLFYPLLERADETLQSGMELLSIQGDQQVKMKHLETALFQVKALMKKGRVSTKQCSDSILELRKDIKIHNDLYRAISYLIGEVRKRGVKRGLGNDVPLWASRRLNQEAVDIDDDVLTYMADAQGYTPRSRPFPELLDAGMDKQQLLVHAQSLQGPLADALPVADLMQWLSDNCAEASDVNILQLYQQLIAQDERWRTAQHNDWVATGLRDITAIHYPHKLNSKQELDTG